MNVKDFTPEREWLAQAIESEDPLFEESLREEAFRVKLANVGPEVYLRGLIEISNICEKNCLYCGIRRDIRCQRYELSDEEVLAAARTAASANFGSVVIQGGERTDSHFINKITRLVKAIREIPSGNADGKPLGITLSLGEQAPEVYKEWFDAGAHRYLLRIESSNPDLYRKIHPESHSYDRRIKALYSLKEIGYQAGTGAMIGLPFQTADDMARDLLFYKEFDAPMIGMGPYNPHPETPLTLQGASYPGDRRRFSLGLKMIALLRLLMPDINIAAATALEVLDSSGRKNGILSGANVVMPNVTPEDQMVKYNLYNRKTIITHLQDLRASLSDPRIRLGLGKWGDSRHFQPKQQA